MWQPSINHFRLAHITHGMCGIVLKHLNLDQSFIVIVGFVVGLPITQFLHSNYLNSLYFDFAEISKMNQMRNHFSSCSI